MSQGIEVKPPRFKSARCRVCFAPASVMLTFFQRYEDGGPSGSNHEESIHLCSECREKLKEVL